MMHYVKIIQIHILFIVLNVKRIYVFFVKTEYKNHNLIDLSKVNYSEESKKK